MEARSMSLGIPELSIIFLIVIVLFGASKLPQLGRGLGEGIKNFRRGIKGDDDPDPDPGDDAE
jgi:sec-independent protein translocase protein TatA